MMLARDRAVLEAFAAGVREVQPAARIWAFGSRARGTADADSDLDVCVVVPVLDEATDRAIMGVAWEVGFANQYVITTVTYSFDEFEVGPCSVSPLVRVIRSEGVAA